MPRLRIFTYTDEDGNVYYSFHRHIMSKDVPVRLSIVARVGEPLVEFLIWCRKLLAGEQP